MVDILFVKAGDITTATRDSLLGVGLTCEVARATADARSALSQDDELRALVLDAGLTAQACRRLIDFAEKRRTDVALVGQGRPGRWEKFQQLGLRSFLAEPWTAVDLQRCLLSVGDQGSGATRRSKSLRKRSAGPGVADEEIRFLNRNSVFHVLSAEARKEFYRRGTIVACERGEHLFLQGEPCTSLYVIKSGLIEVQREQNGERRPKTVALLRNGDLLCELGVLQGTPHRSLARAMEPAQVLKIERSRFERILELYPQLAVSMYEVLSQRMESMILREGGLYSATGDLQGCLDWFDIATVLQSVVSDDSLVGAFLVHDDSGECVARVLVRKGMFVTAQVGTLRGEAAFHELFRMDLSGHRFSFRKRPIGKVHPRFDLSAVPSMALLLDAARVKDEVSLVPASM